MAPIDGATGVPVNNTVITAQFSEPVAALADSDFTVNCEAPCTNAVGTVSMNTAQTIATFTVSAPGALEASTEYTASIVTATSVANGQIMQAPFVWGFTTGLAPDTTKPRVISTGTADLGPWPDGGRADQHGHYRDIQRRHGSADHQ
ncbi:MAG: Ig-like domain-containing protein [Gammaproteobacteria bacterium]|nr:Ig-like domain-containing protein [Gammaproteobacteria bacterium]